MKSPLLLSPLVLLLAACGGGGSDSPSPQDPPTVPIDILSFAVPDNLASGDAIAIYATLDAESGTLDSRGYDFLWRQVSGAPLDIANPRAPIAAFELPDSGAYELSLTVTDGDGTVYQDNIEFSAAGTSDGMNILRDHQVVEGNRVSLRVQAQPDDSEEGWGEPRNIQWTQTAGPAVSFNEEGEASASDELRTFNAPQVGRDTLLKFEAQGTLDGQTVTDEVWVLVTNEAPLPNDYWLDVIANGLAKPGFARVQAYRDDSPWAAGLEKCVYDPQLRSPCNTSELPLIGQNTPNPSVDDIMDRVLVSHPWMGEQFEAFLRQRDPFGDFRALLTSVNAVVISYDIRPSFYWVGTGAIYLDPSDLWQAPWQRDTINEAADFRSGFGNQLQFLMPWRYVRDNDYASLFYPRWLRIERPWEDLEPDLASLLYHELAHANDFFPRDTHAAIDADSIVEEWDQRDRIVSDDLSQGYPLGSEQMQDLAQVSFQGATATPAQRAYLPSDVTTFFTGDRASDYYNYSTTREDLAMVFEEAMMQHRYGILRDVAVTGGRDEDPARDLLVDWGQRGRIGEAVLAPRLQLILDALLPEVGSGQLLQGLATPQPFRAGETWWDNIDLGTPALAPQSLDSRALRTLRPGLVPVTHSHGRHPVPIPVPKVN